jgi:hypothetical protein
VYSKRYVEGVLADKFQAAKSREYVWEDAPIAVEADFEF